MFPALNIDHSFVLIRDISWIVFFANVTGSVVTVSCVLPPASCFLPPDLC